MGEAAAPTGSPTQLRTVVQQVYREVITGVVEPQVMEGSMGLDQGVPPVGLMGATGDSRLQDLTDTMLLQETSLLA